MQAMEELWVFKEAMAYLRVSRSTLIRMMRAGQIPAHKVGATWRFLPSEVRATVGVPEEKVMVTIEQSGEYTPETFYRAEQGESADAEG